jgi:hypothetical protein
MMKNLLIVFTVLAMASAANAGLFISVNGVENPEDTTIELLPSEHAVIDIAGDGLTGGGVFFLGVKAGDPGLLDCTNAVMLWTGNAGAVYPLDDPETAGVLGLDNPVTLLELTHVGPVFPPLIGKIADLIDFHCVGLGDVTLLLLDGDGELVDSQVIHQIPEPITFALLGLGGLFLRRRK